MNKRSVEQICQFMIEKRFENFKPNHNYSTKELSDILNIDIKNFKEQFDTYYYKPKLPNNSYLLFSKDIRKQITIDNSEQIKDMTLSEKNDYITLKIDELWSNLDKSDKQNYFDKADNLKKNYKNKLKIWNEYKLSQREIIYNIS
jgi:hypothetical protein